MLVFSNRATSALEPASWTYSETVATPDAPIPTMLVAGKLYVPAVNEPADSFVRAIEPARSAFRIAPVSESFAAGRWGALLNLASADTPKREHAVEEATCALQIARRLPFRTFVVHTGVTRGEQQAPGENTRDAARRSIEELAAAAKPLGVTIAVELIANELSRAGSLVHFVEDVLDAGAASICLDLGHAQLEGDLVDIIETVSEHIALVHAHDNRGRNDDHLVPFDGTIDWASAITALQKVGYDGTIVLEVTPQGSTKDTLARARTARGRMERLLTTL